MASKYPFRSIFTIYWCDSPISGALTPGSCSRMMCRSAGLSSMKTRLSGSRFRDSAISRKFLSLGSQLARISMKSSGARVLSGCFSPARAFSSSFFESMFSTTPSCFCAFRYCWNSVNTCPWEVSCPMRICSGPSSPMTPPHSVLSRSSTSPFLFFPNRDLIILATLNDRYGIALTFSAYLYICQ